MIWKVPFSKYSSDHFAQILFGKHAIKAKLQSALKGHSVMKSAIEMQNEGIIMAYFKRCKNISLNLCPIMLNTFNSDKNDIIHNNYYYILCIILRCQIVTFLVVQLGKRHLQIIQEDENWYVELTLCEGRFLVGDTYLLHPIPSFINFYFLFIC